LDLQGIRFRLLKYGFSAVIDYGINRLKCGKDQG
jgi:hypothetical protein